MNPDHKDIVFSHLTKRFGEHTVFDDDTFTVPGSGITAVMGESGRGKTTLFSLLLGLEKPDGGEILNPYQKISCAFQDPRLLPWLDATENVTLVLKGIPKAEKLRRTDALFLRLGISEAARNYPHELSGGMQQRVSLARAFAYDGDLLLLDEPFRGLDEKNKDAVLSLIRETGERIPVLITTHDAGDIPKLGARLLMLDRSVS